MTDRVAARSMADRSVAAGRISILTVLSLLVLMLSFSAPASAGKGRASRLRAPERAAMAYLAAREGRQARLLELVSMRLIALRLLCDAQGMSDSAPRLDPADRRQIAEARKFRSRKAGGGSGPSSSSARGGSSSGSRRAVPGLGRVRIRVVEP